MALSGTVSKLEGPPSSPVAGTSFDKYLGDEVTSALPANLTRLSRQELEMLAKCARWVFEQASIALEKTGQNPVTICHYLSPSLSPEPGYTLAQLEKDFLGAKARIGRSDRYLRALRVSLRSFSKGRGQTPIENITVTEIETWLDKSDWAARTKKGYLSDVRTMFNFALKRNLMQRNPAAAVENPVVESGPPAIHTPDQVRAVLDFARSYDLDICRCLAVRYFAGLRSSEAERLLEAHIRDGFIEVTAALAKTRRRRLVAVQPNLAEWLKLGGKLPLHDLSNTWRLFRTALKQTHGLEWAHNVTRHSFVSYHLAQFGNAGKTALEAGHSEQMLFSNYRELVTPAAAAAYWEIRPQ